MSDDDIFGLYGLIDKILWGHVRSLKPLHTDRVYFIKCLFSLWPFKPSKPSYLSILVLLAIRDLKSEIYMMQHCPPSPSQFVACVEHKALTVTSGVTCGNHKASKGHLSQTKPLLVQSKTFQLGKKQNPFLTDLMVWLSGEVSSLEASPGREVSSLEASPGREVSVSCDCTVSLQSGPPVTRHD